MGINGLLPALKDAMEPVHVSALRGKTVGVDAYGWIYRAATVCAADLCLGLDTSEYVDYCRDMVAMLRRHGVTPLLVFDGCRLPAKRGTHASRREARQQSLADGRAAARAHNHRRALQCFRKAVTVTPDMAQRVMRCMQADNVECLVAPYEADAQLTFLQQRGRVHAVVSEDSDLVPYGCSNVLFKLDKLGNAVQYLSQNLGAATSLDLHGWTTPMLASMCVLSGCDYGGGVHGVGLRTAHSIVRRLRKPAAICAAVTREYGLPPSFKKEFHTAVRVFAHQRVWDASTGRVVPLRPLPPAAQGRALKSIGRDIPPPLAAQLVAGQLAPAEVEQRLRDAPQSPEAAPPAAPPAAASSPVAPVAATQEIDLDDAIGFSELTPLSLSVPSSAPSPVVAEPSPPSPAPPSPAPPSPPPAPELPEPAETQSPAPATPGGPSLFLRAPDTPQTPLGATCSSLGLALARAPPPDAASAGRSMAMARALLGGGGAGTAKRLSLTPLSAAVPAKRMRPLS